MLWISLFGYDMINLPGGIEAQEVIAVGDRKTELSGTYSRRWKVDA